MFNQREELTELHSVCTKIWTAVETKSIQDLNAKDFRIINAYRKLKNKDDDFQELFGHLSEGLLQILISGALHLEIQIIASTAFCLLLTQQHSDHALIKFKEILVSDDFQSLKIDDITQRKRNYQFKICFFYGILQCEHAFWTNISNISSINDLINNQMFDIILELCFQYNNLCFIAFKVLVNLIKRINSIDIADIQCSETNFKGTMNIIMSNWENPLSGVRDQNLLVLEQLLSIKSNYWRMYFESSENDVNKPYPFVDLVLTELTWMIKSKYFILSAVLRHYGVNEVMNLHKEDTVNGLLSSLHFSHLVSAGSDLYQIILSSYTFDQWEETFLCPILEALTQSTNKLVSENVINYWLPHTIKIYPESLKYIIKKLQTGKDVNVFSYVSLLKLARKEGQEITKWNIIVCDPLTTSGLLSDCDKIRSQAFYLICISSKSSVQPSRHEINFVQMFLEQNVSIDNAAMRQNLLNGFTLFVNRIKNSTLDETKKEAFKYNKVSVDINCYYKQFLKWIYTFLLNNLQFDSNYQRKFTTLQLYKIILNTFYLPVNSNRIHGKIIDNTDFCSTIGEADDRYNFISTESKNILIKIIHDTAEDVCTLAAEILISYFNIHESELPYYKELLQNSLKLSTDLKFYKAESGALLFQTILFLISNSSFSEGGDFFKTEFGDTVSDYLQKLLEEQLEHFAGDMLSAVIHGSPLYGLLNIFERLLSDGSKLTGTLTSEQIEKIIVLIEKIVSLLLKVLSSQSDPSSDYAPSFAEMGMAIASLVDQSLATDDYFGIAHLEEYPEGGGNICDLQLTPSQQLVLNCIWHNMKACSRIASKLIALQLNADHSKRCMQLLCQVLCKCRHKGAIESAGLALYQATKYLTSSDKLELRDIPQTLLHQFLNSLMNANSTTVSRRSAGLAILVHRIASGDSQLGKPLLHICVSKFINVLQDFEEPDDVPLIDLPQTQSLHFLKTLVQDSSLRQEMTTYINHISLLCFKNLGSTLWTLRNAALQLFGALLPKLTVQKKIHEGESCSINNNLAIEELYYHNKPLIKMIINELSIANSTNSLQFHSRMMPLLTLLSNFTVTFQSLQDPELNLIYKSLSQLFYSLFKSEIYNVRKLSAKCGAWFCLPSELVKCVADRVKNIIGYVLKTQCTITSNNELHGCLLNIKYLISRFNESKIANKIIQSKEESLILCLSELNIIMKHNINNHFIVQSVILHIVRDMRKKSYRNIIEITNILNHYPIISGPYYSALLDLKLLITNCDARSIIDILQHCFSIDNFDSQIICLNVVKNRIKTVNCCDIYNSMLNCLNNVIHQENCKSQIIEIVLDILLQILNCDYELCLNVQIDLYLKIIFELKLGSKCSTLALPVLCGIISKQSEEFSGLKGLCLEIFFRSQPTLDEEVRMSAAKSLHFIFEALNDIDAGDDYIGKGIWKTTVLLIQDEDKEIRLETSKFVFTNFKSHIEMWISHTYSNSLSDVSLNITNCNPFLALQFLFTTWCLGIFMSKSCAILTMWEMLSSKNNVLLMNKNNKDTLNPFYNYKNNMYLEEIIIIEMIRDSGILLISNLNKETLIEIQNYILNQEICIDTDSDKLHENLDLKCKKLKYKNQFFNLLIEKIND